MAQTSGSTAATPGAPPAPLPLFYQRPAPLTAQRHGTLSLSAIGLHGFARGSNAIPLSIGEFGVAARHYPIVFAAARSTLPVALVGFAADANLFVDRAGRWRDGVYVPAYVRRYPFIFIETPGGKDYVLGIDEAASALKPGEGDRLFLDGKPTATVDRALAFCREYQADLNATRQLCDALEAESLLVDKEADVELKDGRKTRLTGFRVIDETRFNKLGAKTFLRYRQYGWLPAIYLHLAAVGNWTSLVDLAAARGA